jgi:hypothetical protein
VKIGPAWADTPIMPGVTPHEQFSRARELRGEELGTLSARTGLRVHHVRAIEEGRFSDLPPGIYGRATIRALAAAYALDPDQLLADCEPLLTHPEDPVSALARLRGMTPAPGPTPTVAPDASVQPELRWRAFAAACIDGALAGGLLIIVSAGAALLARVPPAALGPSAIALFLVALLQASVYYAWVGGLAGTTLGEFAVGPERLPRDPRPLTLRAIGLRTFAAATADARAIRAMGEWTGRRLTRAAARSAPPTAPSPSLPPPLDREEALTWSMSRRASVPPPPLRPRRG